MIDSGVLSHSLATVIYAVGTVVPDNGTTVSSLCLTVADPQTSITSINTSALPGRGIKPLLSLRRHYRVSIAIWFLVLLMGLPVIWVKGKSYYYTESVFEVAPSFVKTLSTDDEIERQVNSNSNYRQYVNQLSNTIRRYDVMQKVLEILRSEKVDLSAYGETERKVIERLQRVITTISIPDTYMVRIGLEGGEKENLHKIVNAVSNVFLETARKEQLYGSDERLETLQKKKADLDTEIEGLEARRVALAVPLGLATFSESTTNPFDGMLRQAREEYVAAVADRIKSEAVLQAFVQNTEVPGVAGRSLLEMRQQDNGLQLLRVEVTRRSEELQRIMAGLEDRHPAKKPSAMELEEANRRFLKAQADVEKTNFESVNRRLLASVQQAQTVERKLKQSMSEVQRQGVRYAENFQQAMRITDAIKKRQSENNTIRDRINYLSTEQNAIGYVRLMTPALPAITPMGLGKTKLLAIFLLLATGLAIAAPVLLDMLDRRLYTVNDAERLLGMPAAGWQVAVSSLASELYAKEQTRRFAATLMREQSKTGQRLFSFAMVKSGNRAMNAILDTAATLENLGHNVLIVDANSFSPSRQIDVTKYGLSDYLADEIDLDTLIQKIQWNGEAINAVGFGIQTIAGIQRMDRLKTATQYWQEQYEFVLVSLPPLLLSGDSELLIGALKNVFMVIEAQVVSKGEASRAKRLLQKLDPEVVGLYVDNIPLFGDSGYLEENAIETIGKTNIENFMSLSRWRLELQLFFARKLSKK